MNEMLFPTERRDALLLKLAKGKYCYSDLEEPVEEDTNTNMAELNMNPSEMG